MTLPLQSAVIRIGKDSNLNFFKKFKFTLPNSIIRTLDFGKFQRQNSLPGTWIPLKRWYSIERVRLSLSFCEVKFLGNLNCEL